MNFNKNRRVFFYLGILVSVVFLYLSFRSIDYDILINNISKLSVAHILMSVICLLFSYIIRAIRWKYILIDRDIKFSKLYSASMIGNMGNNIFPFRLGEVIKCYVLSYQEGISKSKIMASVVFERILDGITIILIFSLSLLFIDVGQIFVDAAIVALSVFIIAMLTIILSKHREDLFFKIVPFIFFFLPERINKRLNSMLIPFLAGFDVIHNKKYFFIAILYSFILWSFGILGAYFVLLSTNNPISIDLPIILISALVIGVMAPSAPGFIGTYHFVVIFVLGVYGWEKGESASISIVLHGIQFILPIFIGLILTFRLGYSINGLVDSNIQK